MKTKLINVCRDKCSDCRGMKSMLKRKDVQKVLAGYDVDEVNIDLVNESVWRPWSGPGKFVLPLLVWLKDGKMTYRSFGPLTPQTLILKLKKHL